MTEHDNGLDEIERRLIEERPVPGAPFRSALRNRLLLSRRRCRAHPGRPRGLGLRIAAYAACGLALLAVAVIGVAGGGPLAA
jgi:hypothetical protein